MVDATALAALGEQVVRPPFLAYLDIVGDPVRATTWETPITPTGTGDPDLDGQLFGTVSPEFVDIGPVTRATGGSDQVTLTLSGIVGPDSALLDLLGDPTKWKGRVVRLWFMLVAEDRATRIGAVFPYYTGRMMGMSIKGSSSQQTVALVVESYLASLTSASNRFHTLMVIRDNAASQTPRLRWVLNGMFVTFTKTSQFPSAANGYELFRGKNDGSTNDFFANATISDIVIWTGARLTQADAIQAHKWACDKYGQPYPWAAVSSIKVIAGDSVPSAAGQAHDSNVYNLLKADLGFSHGQASIIATPSIGLTEMRTQLQDDLDGITAQTGKPYRVVFGEWANSAGPTPADSQVAAMTNLLNDRQSARGAGSKVGIWDSTAYGGSTSEGDQTSLGGSNSADGNGRLNYGTRIAALTSLFDNFQQVSADANIGVIGANPYSGTWPTTYFADEKHLVPAGLTILKNYYKAAFAAMS